MVGMGTGESGRTMVRSRAHQLEMQEEGEEVILPDELVERILAMVPFPVVFKFRVLSKSWQARLSSIAPRDDDGQKLLALSLLSSIAPKVDDGQKCLALSFQRQMSQRSSNWKTFCPISLSDNRENFVAFDRTSNTWLRIPLPSSLQQKLPAIPAKRVRRRLELRMEGALLLLQISRDEFFVANILTRSWKQLPPCPHDAHLERSHLSSHKSGTYKVVAMPHGHSFLQIYDSNSAAWSTRKFALPPTFSRWELAANPDGVLYLVTGPFFAQAAYLKVLSIKIKEDGLGIETSDQDFNTVAQLDLTRMSLESVNRVICEPNLLIIFLFLRSNVTGDHILQAVHIDFVTGQLLRVTECPVPCPPTIGQAPAANSIADCDDIVATVRLDRSQVLTYNVQEDKWIWLHYSGLGHELARYRATRHQPTIRSYFQPGLNPFAEV